MSPLKAFPTGPVGWAPVSGRDMCLRPRATYLTPEVSTAVEVSGSP